MAVAAIGDMEESFRLAQLQRIGWKQKLPGGPPARQQYRDLLDGTTPG